MPNVEIRLSPAKVQGTDAPDSLIAGVKYLSIHYPPILSLT
jgi:exonuclease VII large subunit